jgi:hypothetical protein
VRPHGRTVKPNWERSSLITLNHRIAKKEQEIEFKPQRRIEPEVRRRKRREEMVFEVFLFAFFAFVVHFSSIPVIAYIHAFRPINLVAP